MYTTVRRETGPNSVVYRHEVPRDVLRQFVRDLGFELDDVAALSINGREITVTQYHPHPSHGGRYIANGGDHGIAAVVYTLALVDDKEDD